MSNNYVYVPCDGGAIANQEFRHYFRLYKITNKVYKLVEQGLADLIPGWEKRYAATMQTENPYPNLD